MWFQFQLTSFGQDLVAGARLVQIMQAQNDPRLPEYFGKNSTGGYGGYDVATQQTFGEPSPIASSGRNTATFGQPIITYDENQLIIAEASLQSGNPVAAAIALNNVRTRHGKGVIAAPTLNDIMTEKYITLFQNMEYWNDYKRTCLPTLTPALGRSAVLARSARVRGASQVRGDPPRGVRSDAPEALGGLADTAGRTATGATIPAEQFAADQHTHPPARDRHHSAAGRHGLVLDQVTVGGRHARLPPRRAADRRGRDAADGEAEER